MKLLYAGRMVRVDICYTINSLSRYVTRWNKLCDKQLAHLFSYLKMTSELKLHGFINCNDMDSIELHAFPDADLAGTFDTSKATSGGLIHISGGPSEDPSTYFPLDWFSKRQTATSSSTTEAELIAASKILRDNLIPLMELWSIMLGRTVKGIIHEANVNY